MKRRQADPAKLNMQVRMSQKVIRRDGTVEEIPGEWQTVSEDEAVKQYGHLESFKRWLERKREELNG